MKVWFADCLEPHRRFRCVEPNKGECLAAVQLLEVFQLNRKRMDYGSHPILKIIEPAESAERFWIVGRCPIHIFQVAGFENFLSVIFKKRDCMMNGKPVHPVLQSAGPDLCFNCGKVDGDRILVQQARKQENRRYSPPIAKQACNLFCGSSELRNVNGW